MRVVALCGSLRAASINAALLRACRRLAPPGMEVQLLDGLRALPLFDPDLEPDAPDPVRALWDAVAGADALLVASPEYAHGITGTMKNALDWLVGRESFPGMAVAVLNASPRAHHADDALREVLRTMSATIVEAASVSLPLLGAKLDEDGMVASPEVARVVGAALEALRDAVLRRAPPPAFAIR
jgi:NAD(P)H-dependent FMN reductase